MNIYKGDKVARFLIVDINVDENQNLKIKVVDKKNELELNVFLFKSELLALAQVITKILAFK